MALENHPENASSEKLRSKDLNQISFDMPDAITIPEFLAECFYYIKITAICHGKKYFSQL